MQRRKDEVVKDWRVLGKDRTRGYQEKGQERFYAASWKPEHTAKVDIY
jgi:hypothetical protein